MSLRLSGSTSGYAEIDAPAVAGSNTLVLPASNGSAYQFLRNGATAGTTEFAAAITSGTAVASTSGTSIDFTSIPSYVKRVTVMFDGVSTNGASPVIIQFGDSGGVEVTGYQGTTGDGGTPNQYSSGYRTGPGTPGVLHGQSVISSFGSNTWAESHIFGRSDSAIVMYGGGSKTLSGTLDRVRITTVNGTDTFDAGSINILYE